MDNFRQTNMNQFTQAGNSTDLRVKTFMTSVFAWMAGALVMTGLVSWAFSHMPALIELAYRTQEGHIVGFAPLGWIAMIAPFIIVIAMGAGFNRFSFAVLSGLFLLYSSLTGVFLSVIFFRYSVETIGATFAISAGMFGIMAIMGFITKADLSRFGSILMMGLFGIIIASVVNWFMHSEGLSYLISFAGVAVFTGLTAWDVQKLKNIATVDGGQENMAKLSIMGAFTLYLDFINIFLFLLRLMGGNRR